MEFIVFVFPARVLGLCICGFVAQLFRLVSAGNAQDFPGGSSRDRRINLGESIFVVGRSKKGQWWRLSEGTLTTNYKETVTDLDGDRRITTGDSIGLLRSP